MFQLTPISCRLRVEGRVASDDVGEFSGMVLAVAMQDTDPVAASTVEDAGHAEGISGWGSTFFLVADPSKPAPVWVAKSDVERHEVE